MTELKQSVTSLSRTARIYRQAVRRTFSFLKQTKELRDLYAKSIPLEDDKGFLVPVCELHASDHRLISTLAKWREENAFAYPTQFPVTIDSTAFWLRARLLDVEDRILFLVLDRHGSLIGQSWLCQCNE